MRRAIGCVLLAACKTADPGGTAPQGTSAPTTATASATATATTTATAATTTTATGSAEPMPTVPCRVLTSARVAFAGDAGTLGVGSEVPDAWMDVEGRLVVKSARSGHETALAAKTRARACVGIEEEIWMTQGALEERGNAGTTGEKWYVTPLGVLRHATADVEVAATKGQVTVHVKKGTAYLWPSASDAGIGEGWDRLDTGATRKLDGEADALRAARRCSTLADEATRLAAAVRTVDAGLGEAATAHMVARRQAHAGCSLARMLAEEMPGSAQKTGVLLRISMADRAWKTVGASPSTKP